MTSVSGDWAEWFRIVGAIPPANVRAGLRVDTTNMALEAARRGYGIALGRMPLFDAEGVASQDKKRRARGVARLLPAPEAETYLVLADAAGASIAPARAKPSTAIFQEPPSRFSILNQLPSMVFSLTVTA